MSAAPFAAARLVIDISGDGTNNVYPAPHMARDEAILAGMTINGLAILSKAGGLDDYFRANVIGVRGRS